MRVTASRTHLNVLDVPDKHTCTPSRAVTRADSTDALSSSDQEAGGSYRHLGRTQGAGKTAAFFHHPPPFPSRRFAELTTISDALNGIILSAWDLEKDEEVAIKVIENEVLNRRRSPKCLESPFIEICVMEYLWSKRAFTPPLFIVKHCDTFQDSTHTFLVQEKCQGADLFNVLSTRKSFPERTIQRITIQLCFALKSLHLNGICHRDVSLENVLFNPTTHVVRLIDFGQAVSLGDSGGKACLLTGEAGKAYYRAPEMYIGPYLGVPVDVFSLGVLVYILATGRPPWQKAVPQDPSYAKITASVDGVEKALRDRSVSPELIDFLTGILYYPAAARPSIGQLLRHRWLAAHDSLWHWVHLAYPTSTLIAHYAPPGVDLLLSQSDSQSNDTRVKSVRSRRVRLEPPNTSRRSRRLESLRYLSGQTETPEWSPSLWAGGERSHTYNHRRSPASVQSHWMLPEYARSSRRHRQRSVVKH